MADPPETEQAPEAEAAAWAEPKRRSETDAKPEQGSPQRPELPEVLSWAGHKLDEIHGASVGRIDGSYVDADGGKPEWLLIRMGRFGHHTLVPARDAVAGAGRVWVPFGGDVIRRAPRVKAGAPLPREQEAALLAHYGIAGPLGRSAEIAERDADAVTARPAS